MMSGDRERVLDNFEKAGDKSKDQKRDDQIAGFKYESDRHQIKAEIAFNKSLVQDQADKLQEKRDEKAAKQVDRQAKETKSLGLAFDGGTENSRRRMLIEKVSKSMENRERSGEAAFLDSFQQSLDRQVDDKIQYVLDEQTRRKSEQIQQWHENKADITTQSNRRSHDTSGRGDGRER